MFLQVFSHFDLDVHYGPILGKILVSPRYHRVHHSSDPAQYNTNFGIIFSFWDYLFGTAAADLAKPRAYGRPDFKLPDDFFLQLFFPFVLLVRRLGGSRVPEPAREPPAEAGARCSERGKAPGLPGAGPYDLAAAQSAALVALGDRLGLYEAMADEPDL